MPLSAPYLPSPTGCHPVPVPTCHTGGLVLSHSGLPLLLKPPLLRPLQVLLDSQEHPIGGAAWRGSLLPHCRRKPAAGLHPQSPRRARSLSLVSLSRVGLHSVPAQTSSPPHPTPPLGCRSPAICGEGGARVKCVLICPRSWEQTLPTGTGICKPLSHVLGPLENQGPCLPLSHAHTAGQVRISGGHAVVSYLTNLWQPSFLLINK